MLSLHKFNMFQWKKTIFKSVGFSFCLLITFTILQNRTSPGFFTQSQQKNSGSQDLLSTHKRETYPVPNGFWAANAVRHLTEAPLTTEKQITEWDVSSINCTANWNLTKMDWYKTLEPNFQQFLLYRHCRYFPMIINNPRKCHGDIDLLIVVKSIITQHDRREVIRQTWGKERDINGKNVRTLFLLGTAMKEEERANYQKLLDFENQIYGDILQWDFLDSFFNLTLKEVHFLKWMSIYCHNIKYIFKGDDDVFVSPTNILEYLDGNNNTDLFVGDVLFKARPIRKKENKYYIPTALYDKPLYPPYAGGGGFLMGGPLAKKLYKASEALELYPIDDVFLGMCLEVIQVKPIMHEGFKTFGIVKNKNSKMNKEPCFFRSMLVVHKLLPDELMHMWVLVHSNLTCTRKVNIL
ncbi:UDP-GlcNAc:betaGal beta-1,3-N-acetylglucosaminyltransferase 7 [Rhinophrynus dorsalis]